MIRTPENIARIRANWAVAAGVPDQVAQAFYARLFRIDPSTRRLFPQDLTIQGRKLTDTLAFIVDHLDDDKALVPAAQDLARRHVDFGVQRDHYASVGQALVGTLAQMLGPNFSEDDEAAWGAVYTELADVMTAAAYDT